MAKKNAKKKRMYSWMNSKLEVRDTKKYGKGVFAKEKLKKDETLFVMGGYILDIEGENRLKGFPEDKPIEISEEFSFSPLSSGDIELMPQHYVNHSCEPNAGWRGQVFMVAMRDIKKGEEITYDYATIICSKENSKNYFKIKCHCGLKNCRGVIDEEGWQDKNLQKKYKGYFQWYLQEKINKLKSEEEKFKEKRRIYSWMNQKLEVRDTKKYGQGVFAKERLKKDEMLAIFGGYIMTLDEESKLPSEIRDSAHQIGENIVIGINRNEDEQDVDFFNHSCNPNAGFKGQLFLVAMRDIEPNEQVTFDYAMTLGGKKPYKLKCFCGAKNCRKIITNYDWKSYKLQSKYNGYFQWYLQEKINNQ